MAAPAFAMTLGNSMLRQFDPTHEIRGGVNAASEALGPGALGPVRVLVTFPDGDADGPASRDHAGHHRSTRMAQAPNVATVSPPVFGKDDDSALMSAVLSVDLEDFRAREAVDWLRAETTGVDSDGAHRCGWPDGADQGLRRSGVGGAAAGLPVRLGHRVRRCC